MAHLNEWPTGSFPSFLEEEQRKDSFFQDTRTLFTLHNLGYQGNFDVELAQLLGIPLVYEDYEYWGQISLLKLAIMRSDWITTISPNYREETLGSLGFGFEDILRSRQDRYSGILEGIGSYWDPRTCPDIAFNYNENNYGQIKPLLKQRFQVWAGLTQGRQQDR